jgi:hypothetical protein
MCQRKENEPILVYLLRYFAEQPRSVLGFLGFAAAVYMYFDLMAFVRENTAVQRENVVQLQEINVRISHLEREHEAARQQSNP